MEGDTLPLPDVFFRPAISSSDLETICTLEASSYPADEAATPERLAFRLEHAGDFFLAAVSATAPCTDVSGDMPLVGFVCSTLTTSPSLTHESMANHEPDGSLLCIHSVCVDEKKRRQGIGSRMMKAYVNYVKQTSPQVKQMRLLCKRHLVDFYSNAAGFTLLGPSPVVHGQDEWMEMLLDLGQQEEC